MGAISLNPYSYLADLQGDALDGGFVYIGVADENPQTSPISIYYDAELTVPAPNPLPTLAGFAVNTGTPVRVYTNETA